MRSTEKHFLAADSFGGAKLLMPGFLAIALLVIVFPLPKPSIQTNHPYKVELLVSLFLIAVFVLIWRHRKTDATHFYNKSSLIIAAAVGVFVLWSAASSIWADSFGSVAHHTLLWSLYLIVFLIFTGLLRWTDANIRFVVTTFALVSLILGALCVFDYLTVPDFTSSEGAIRIRYGKYAELLVTISPFLWAVAVYTRNRRQMALILGTAILSWTTVMLSLSKGAFLAGIIGFVIFFVGSVVFSPRSFRNRLLTFAAVWLAVTIGAQIFFSFFSAVPSTTNYITGAADKTRSTSAMRVFVWKVARQMAADHWLIGVGADNFGLAFNHERALYRQANPDNPAEEIAEDYIVERAHNEPLQVLTELGAIGAILFALPFIVFGIFLLRHFFQNGWRFSPVLWAATAGLAAFAVSSQFSSFSFRAAQNGIVFFMVLAVALNQMSKRSERSSYSNLGRPAFVGCSLVVLLMTVFCAAKAYAEFQVYKAERSTEYSEAAAHYRSAVAADPEYAGAYLSHASRAATDDAVLSAQLTRKAIDHGLGVTPVYSQLAKQHFRSGDAVEAEDAYREALMIYPRSPYIRAEFAVFLENQGRQKEADEQMAVARSADLRQANGWYFIIKEGSVAAFYRSLNDQSIAPPADLTPYNAVRQYVDKVPGMEPVE